MACSGICIYVFDGEEWGEPVINGCLGVICGCSDPAFLPTIETEAGAIALVPCSENAASGRSKGEKLPMENLGNLEERNREGGGVFFTCNQLLKIIVADKNA